MNAITVYYAVCFLFRHEMQHFVHNLEGYLSNQILNVTWSEFQEELLNVCEHKTWLTCGVGSLTPLVHSDFQHVFISHKRISCNYRNTLNNWTVLIPFPHVFAEFAR